VARILFQLDHRPVEQIEVLVALDEEFFDDLVLDSVHLPGSRDRASAVKEERPVVQLARREGGAGI
jgi:hypothetical protein